jgi:hypothetical protein
VVVVDPGAVVVVDGEVVVVGHVVVVDGGSVVTVGGDVPWGSVSLIWRLSAVIAPTTTSTTSATRIVYSRTDAPCSLSTRRRSFTRAA